MKRNLDIDEEALCKKKRKRMKNQPEDTKNRTKKEDDFRNTITSKQAKELTKTFAGFEFVQKNANMRCTICHKAKGDSQFAEWIDISKKIR